MKFLHLKQFSHTKCMYTLISAVGNIIVVGINEYRYIVPCMQSILYRGVGRCSEREDSMSSSSQEGSRSFHSSHSRLSRHFRSPSSSPYHRSSSRRSSRSHAPSRSSHGSGGSSGPPFAALVGGSPMLASRRTTPSATVSQAPPSPPPVFVMPVGPTPPPYTSRPGSSHAPPRLLLPLFPSMTPPPRYVSLSPSCGVMGPPPASRPTSQ